MIISVTSLKGGVGKSTITQNLAVCFAQSGYKVCIADADTNQSALRWSSLRSSDLPSVPAFGTPEKTLSSNIKQLNADYEIVLIDGTPSLDRVTSRIILLADIVLVPILPSGLDIWATEQFLERLADARAQKESGHIPAYFILNQFQSNLNLNKEFKEVLNDTDIPVLESMLRPRVAYREAVIKGLGVYEFKDDKAKSEFIALYNEILGIITGE